MKIEAGTILIATDPCITIPTNKPSLIVGKEYPVISVDERMLTLISEGGITHFFYFTEGEFGYWGNYFKIKGYVSDPPRNLFTELLTWVAENFYIEEDKYFHLPGKGGWEPLSPEYVTKLYVEHKKSKLGGDQLIHGADLS